MERADAREQDSSFDAFVHQQETMIGRWLARFWKPLFVSLYVAKMIRWFHAIDLSSGLPITNVDYIEYYGRILRMHEFLSRSGRIWGYDPFDMAGYIAGPFLEVGTHAMAVVAHVLEPFLPIWMTVLFMEIAGLVAAPWLVFAIFRAFGAGRRAAWIGFGFVTLTFGVCEPFSSLMIKMGLWGSMLSGFLGVFQVALLYRWMEDEGLELWAGLIAVTAVLFQLHPTAFIIVVAPNVALYALNARRLSWRSHALLALGAAIVALANWDWISPFMAFSNWRLSAPFFETHGLAELFFRLGPVQGDIYTSIAAIANTSAIVLALIAVRRIYATRPMLARVLAVWLGWLFVVSFFGSYLPWIRTLQPGRNQFAFFLIVYLLSATVFEEVVMSGRRRRVIAVLVLSALGLYTLDLGPATAPWIENIPPFQTELRPWQVELIDYLRSIGPVDGRVLLECADDLKPHFADVVPSMTGAVLVGGQHPGNFLATRFSLFMGIYQSEDDYRPPMAFSKDLTTLSPADFSAYLSLYNVHLIAARTPPMLQALDRMDDVIELANELPPHRVYRVKSPSTWFQTGSGRLSFDYDKITIDDASQGPLVAKVHWIKTFKADPDVPLRPVFLMDDPVPFVGIDNTAGHRHIEIINVGLPPVSERIRSWFKEKF